MRKSLLIVVLSFVLTIYGYSACKAYAGMCCGVYQDCLCSGGARVDECIVDFYVYRDSEAEATPNLKYWFTDDPNNPCTVMLAVDLSHIVCTEFAKRLMFDRNGTLEFFFYTVDPDCRDPDSGTHCAYLTNCQ